MNRHFLRALVAVCSCLWAGLVCADVVVVVAANNPVASLTAEQVAQIFLAKSVAYPGGGAAAPVDQEESSAEFTQFYSKVTGKDAAQLKSYWSQLVFTGKAQRPPKMAGNAAVKRAVAEKPGGIGYIDAGAVDDTVKVVLKP